jgi:ribosomal protein S7
MKKNDSNPSQPPQPRSKSMGSGSGSSHLNSRLNPNSNANAGPVSSVSSLGKGNPNPNVSNGGNENRNLRGNLKAQNNTNPIRNNTKTGFRQEDKNFHPKLNANQNRGPNSNSNSNSNSNLNANANPSQHAGVRKGNPMGAGMQGVQREQRERGGQRGQGNSNQAFPLEGADLLQFQQRQQKQQRMLVASRKGEKQQNFLAYEAVTLQFTHRLIQDGKASKARSIFEKAAVLLSQGSAYREFLTHRKEATSPVLSPWLSATLVSMMDSPKRRRCRWSRRGLDLKAAATTFIPSNSSLGFRRAHRLFSKTSLLPQPMVFGAVGFALDKVKPIVEPKMVKRAGRSVCVPAEITMHRQLSLAVRWVIESARKRSYSGSTSSMVESLAHEWEDILSGNMECGSLKKRDQWHRLVQTNRANTNMKRSF